MAKVQAKKDFFFLNKPFYFFLISLYLRVNVSFHLEALQQKDLDRLLWESKT